jgi:hypothetical protein
LQGAVRLYPQFAAFVYQHGAEDILQIISQLGDEASAIYRAKALMIHHGPNPRIDANPSTQVHLLVEDLRSWIAYYSYTPEG